MDRRGFMQAILATAVAPYVVTTAGVLMPVRKVWTPPSLGFELRLYSTEGELIGKAPMLGSPEELASIYAAPGLKAVEYMLAYSDGRRVTGTTLMTPPKPGETLVVSYTDEKIGCEQNWGARI